MKKIYFRPQYLDLENRRPCLIHASSTSLASTYEVIFPKKQDTVINSTEEETRYSRAYVTELALQYREEEFISRIQLKESGIQFQVGFSTDVSESCIWVSPFIKPGIPNDMSDLRFVKIRNIDFFNLSEFFYLNIFLIILNYYIQMIRKKTYYLAITKF